VESSFGGPLCEILQGEQFNGVKKGGQGGRMTELRGLIVARIN